jgi:hypothetical protein
MDIWASLYVYSLSVVRFSIAFVLKQFSSYLQAVPLIWPIQRRLALYHYYLDVDHVWWNVSFVISLSGTQHLHGKLSIFFCYILNLATSVFTQDESKRSCLGGELISAIFTLFAFMKFNKVFLLISLAPPHKITTPLYLSVGTSSYKVLMIWLVLAPGLIKPQTSYLQSSYDEDQSHIFSMTKPTYLPFMFIYPDTFTNWFFFFLCR